MRSLEQIEAANDRAVKLYESRAAKGTIILLPGTVERMRHLAARRPAGQAQQQPDHPDAA